MMMNLAEVSLFYRHFSYHQKFGVFFHFFFHFPQFLLASGFYKRQKRTRDWLPLETLKFYRSLQTIGTDFSVMLQLFPNRSRRDLKLKVNSRTLFLLLIAFLPLDLYAIAVQEGRKTQYGLNQQSTATSQRVQR